MANRLSMVMFFNRNEQGTFDCVGRTKIIKQPFIALEIYANTPNPASQLIEGETEEELLKAADKMEDDMHDLEYLAKNVEPYL